MQPKLRMKANKYHSHGVIPYEIVNGFDACIHAQIQIGGGGGGGGQGLQTPLKNRKNIVFLSNTGPDHLKNHKATKPALNVGLSSACQRSAI